MLRGEPMPAPLVRQLPALADVEVRHRFMQQEVQLREERLQAAGAAFEECKRLLLLTNLRIASGSGL